VLPSGLFRGRFWDRFRLFDHRKAWSGRPLLAFAPSGRFSARFGHAGGCANQLQKAGHGPTHLPRRHRTLFALPRTHEGQIELFAQQQQIVRASHDPTPPFHLHGGAQMRPCPEQVLFEKAVAMLLGESLAIPRTHLLQGHVLFACPKEPTDAWVPFAVTGPIALYAKDTDLLLWHLAKVQVFPAGHHPPFALLIGRLRAWVRSPTHRTG
jgi:hypothetical protein